MKLMVLIELLETASGDEEKNSQDEFLREAEAESEKDRSRSRGNYMIYLNFHVKNCKNTTINIHFVSYINHNFL